MIRGARAFLRLGIPPAAVAAEPGIATRRILPICARTLADRREGRVLGRCATARFVPLSDDDAADARTPAQSFLELTLPFATEPDLADAFRMFDSGEVRFGLVAEVLDTFACDVALRHTRRRDHALVTAAVDQISWKGGGAATVDGDLVIRGAVGRVGRSSIDVLLRMLAVRDGGAEEEEVGSARFVIVSRPAADADAAASSVPLARLVAGTDDEGALLDEAAALAGAAREARALRGPGGATPPPTADEIAFVHECAQHAADAAAAGDGDGDGDGDGAQQAPLVDIEDTAVESTRVMHGQDRNLNGQIFGGHLMRASYELAWTAAALHAKRTPRLVFVDEIEFRAPVPVASVLRMDARVTYADAATGLLSVGVAADVVDPASGRSVRTTEFTYVLDVPGDGGALAEVSPARYATVPGFLEGRRAVQRIRG